MYDNLQPVRPLMAILHTIGVWHYKETRLNRLYGIYWMALHLFITLPFLLSLSLYTVTTHDKDERTEGLYMMLIETGMLVKLCMLLWHSQLVRQMFEHFGQRQQLQPTTVDELHIVVRAHRKFEQLRNIYTMGAIISVSANFVMILFTEQFNYQLAYNVYLPFEYEGNYARYAFALAFVGAGMLVTAASNLAMNLCMSFLLLQVGISYQLLAQRLVQLSSEDSAATDSLHCLYRQHSALNRLTTDCQRMLSIPVTAQIMLSAFILCLSMYRLQSETLAGNPGHFIHLVTFVGSVSLNTFLLCYYGNLVTEASDLLATSIYRCPWTDMALHMQREIFVFMEHLKRPVVICGGNFFQLNLPLFANVMKAAYKFYCVLRRTDMEGG